MASTPKIALIAAIPLELINFFLVGYPADPGSVSTASRNPAVALEWYVLHLPGIIASDRSIFLREHGRLDSLVLFLAGFVSTGIVLAICLGLFRVAARRLRKLSSPLRHAH